MKPVACFALVPCAGLVRIAALGVVLLPAIAAAGSHPEACKLITKSEVEATLGEPVAEPRAQVTSTGSATLAAVSRCEFDAAHPQIGESASLMARYSPVANPSASDGVRGSLKMMGGEPKDIAGVGDKALWVFRQGGHMSSGQLNVFSKGTIYLIVSVTGVGEEATALQKAKTLALKALGRV